MERPLFSIITITFNAAGTLPATLRSVERQTFTDYEYLIETVRRPTVRLRLRSTRLRSRR